MHRRRASWNIPDLLAWIFTKNGFRAQLRRADARGRWNTSAKLPMNLARSASCAIVFGVPASRWRFVMRPDRAAMAFIANSHASAIGATGGSVADSDEGGRSGEDKSSRRDHARPFIELES